MEAASKGFYEGKENASIGTIHHIVATGIERRLLFRDDGDRDGFLQRADPLGTGPLYLELIESLRGKQVFDGHLLCRQTLLKMITAKCVERVPVLFNAVGPPVIAH